MAEIRSHKGDISDEAMARYTGDIAIDTETLGLVPRRDRLWLTAAPGGAVTFTTTPPIAPIEPPAPVTITTWSSR